MATVIGFGSLLEIRRVDKMTTEFIGQPLYREQYFNSNDGHDIPVYEKKYVNILYVNTFCFCKHEKTL